MQTLLSLGFISLGALDDAGTTLMVAAIYGAMLLANAASLAHVLLAHPTLRPLRRLPLRSLRIVLAQGGMLFAVTIAKESLHNFMIPLAPEVL